jgi:hypothetical protein
MRFIAEVEAAQGSLIGLIERFSLNRWTVAELAGVIRHGLALEAGLDAREIAEAVHEAGPAHLLAPVLALCHNALTGGRPLGGGGPAPDALGNGQGAAALPSAPMTRTGASPSPS